VKVAPELDDKSGDANIGKLFHVSALKLCVVRYSHPCRQQQFSTLEQVSDVG
jgi:hypothetical protein